MSICEWIWMSLRSMVPDTPLEAFGLLVVVIVACLMTSLVGKPAELLASSNGNIDHSRLACPSCGVVSRPLRARTHQISAFSLTPKALLSAGSASISGYNAPEIRGDALSANHGVSLAFWMSNLSISATSHGASIASTNGYGLNLS